jgi:hypothetical protein
VTLKKEQDNSLTNVSLRLGTGLPGHSDASGISAQAKGNSKFTAPPNMLRSIGSPVGFVSSILLMTENARSARQLDQRDANVTTRVSISRERRSAPPLSRSAGVR